MEFKFRNLNNKFLPCLLALVAWISNASGWPPLISGPSSSGFLKTKYLLISNSSNMLSSWSISLNSKVLSSTDIDDKALLAGLDDDNIVSKATLFWK